MAIGHDVTEVLDLIPAEVASVITSKPAKEARGHRRQLEGALASRYAWQLLTVAPNYFAQVVNSDRHAIGRRDTLEPTSTFEKASATLSDSPSLGGKKTRLFTDDSLKLDGK